MQPRHAADEATRDRAEFAKNAAAAESRISQLPKLRKAMAAKDQDLDKVIKDRDKLTATVEAMKLAVARQGQERDSAASAAA